MAVSINCGCSFRDDLHWHCEWATVAAGRQVDRRVAFSVSPAQFVEIVSYLENVLARTDRSVLRPKLGGISLQLRYRRNANAFELRMRGDDATLKAMIDERQLREILEYHRNCLKSYGLAIYEGRTPVPEGYPHGYPEPYWHVESG